MPDRPSDRQLAPWEAVLAQALQQDEPERTALEAIQAAQDFTTHAGHLFQLRQAFWRLDVVPQIDEMVRQRITPGASTSGTCRTRSGPRSCRSSASTRSAAAASRTCWTRSPPSRWTGSAASPRDCTAGREKNRPRRGGRRRTWAERTPRRPRPRSEAGATRWRTSGRPSSAARLAGRPPQWALRRVGRPAGRAGARCGTTGSSRPGIVGYYREASRHHRPGAGDRPGPGRAGPTSPSCSARAVRALQLPDEAALLKAMGRGELEAHVGRARPGRGAGAARRPGRDRRAAAPSRRRQVRAHMAGGAGTPRRRRRLRPRPQRRSRGPGPAGRRRRGAAGVDRGARRAGGRGPRRPRRELRHAALSRADPGHRRRGGRGSGAARRPFPEIDPDGAANWRAEQTARVEAGKTGPPRGCGAGDPGHRGRDRPVRRRRRARGGTGSRGGDSGEDRAAVLEEIRAEIDAISAKVDQIAAQDAGGRPNGAPRWTRRPSTSPWCTNPRLSRPWRPPGSLATRRAATSRRPEQDAEPEMEMANRVERIQSAFAQPGAVRH